MYKEKVLQWLQNYKDQNNCKGVVIGISGGKDSTTVAMLAKKIWNDSVFAILMPNGRQSDINDSLSVVNSLSIPYRIVNIETIYNSLLNVTELKIDKNDSGELDFMENCPPISKKAKTNIPPRIRMTILYAVAQTLGYHVIGTGNASERYIGWFTKWGDGAYDLNPIAGLTCTQVINLGLELAEEFNIDKILITKKPADGLTGKTDEDNFGFTYKQLDVYLEKNVGQPSFIEDINKLHLQTNHKRKLPPNFPGL